MVDKAVQTVTVDTDLFNVADIEKDILACFNAEEPIREQSKFWKETVVFQHAYSGDEISPYLQVACTVFEAAQPPRKGTSASTDWQRAIDVVIKNKQRLSNFGMTPVEMLRSFEPQSIALAKSARCLSFLGDSLNVKDGVLTLEDDAHGKIDTEIDKLCKTIGGPFMCFAILKDLNPAYDVRLGRYQLRRDLSRERVRAAQPQIPWGYLFQLSIKHYLSPSPQTAPVEAWNGLKELLTACIVIYNLQPWSIFENLFVNKESIIRDLTKDALYDSLFCMQQIRVRDLKLMLHGLLGGFNLDRNGVNVQSAIAVAESVLDIDSPRLPYGVQSKTIADRTSISQPMVKQILEEVFADPPKYANAPNAGLTFPPRMSDIDFLFRPLMRPIDDVYVVTSKEMCAPAFFEAVLALGRSVDSTIEEAVGKIAETFLADEFRKHNVTSKAGDFNCGKDASGNVIEGECDLVVETNDFIFLFELKKKALTRAARSGTDTQIFIDLSKSLIEAQLQLMRREVLLRRFGRLELVKNGNIQLVELDGRQVERVAVSLMDYGSLQYKRTLEKFLAVCCMVDFGTHHQKYQKEFECLNENLQELRELANELELFKRSIPFMSAWFLSIPQILVMLDRVDSNEDLKREFWFTKFGSYGTQDFYQEYSWSVQASDANG